MWSGSFADDAWRYAATRIARPRIVGLWLALCAAAQAASRAPSVEEIAGVSLLQALLLLQFRLWDDLTDRARDAQTYPQRVLVKTLHVQRFVRLCIGLGGATAAALWSWRAPSQVMGYCALCAAFVLLYAARRRIPNALWPWLIALKYPLFVGIAAVRPMPLAAVLSGLAIWAAVSIIDTRDGPVHADRAGHRP